MSSSLSMIVDAEHGPISERMLKEDAPLVQDAGSVGEEDFAPVLKKAGKENQDVRFYCCINFTNSYLVTITYNVSTITVAKLLHQLHEHRTYVDHLAGHACS